MKKLDMFEVNLSLFIVALAVLIALGYDSTLEQIFVGLSVVWLGGERYLKGRRNARRGT